MTRTILILSGGGDAPPRGPLPGADEVLAADSGLELAESLELRVDLVVGDLDSVDPEALRSAELAGAVVERHPADKDATDLELAMEAAIRRGAGRIVVAGGGGGRLDHLLGVALLLTDERWAAVDVEWHTPRGVAHVLRDARQLSVGVGDLISLIPVSRDAVASIQGTRWALDRAPLPRGTTRGISNEALADTIDIDIHRGAVFAVVTRGDTT